MKQIVLARHPDGSPALWLTLVKQEIIDNETGRRYFDYEGTTLNDDRTSIPFDPSLESLEDAVEQWKAIG